MAPDLPAPDLPATPDVSPPHQPSPVPTPGPATTATASTNPPHLRRRSRSSPLPLPLKRLPVTSLGGPSLNDGRTAALTRRTGISPYWRRATDRLFVTSSSTRDPLLVLFQGRRRPVTLPSSRLPGQLLRSHRRVCPPHLRSRYRAPISRRGISTAGFVVWREPRRRMPTVGLK
jgi:hypothetical protein